MFILWRLLRLSQHSCRIELHAVGAPLSQGAVRGLAYKQEKVLQMNIYIGCPQNFKGVIIW